MSQTQSALEGDRGILSGAERAGPRSQLCVAGYRAEKRIENANVVKIDHNFGIKNRLSFTWTGNGEHFIDAYDTNPANPLNWSACRIRFPAESISMATSTTETSSAERYAPVQPASCQYFDPGRASAHASRSTTSPSSLSARTGATNWAAPSKNNPGYNTGFPPVSFQNDNYYGWDSSKLWDEYHTVYGLDENVTWIKNNHSFKFGYSYQMMMLNTNNRNNAAGNFNFNRMKHRRYPAITAAIRAVPLPASCWARSIRAASRFRIRRCCASLPRRFRAGRLEDHSAADDEYRTAVRDRYGTFTRSTTGCRISIPPWPTRPRTDIRARWSFSAAGPGGTGAGICINNAIRLGPSAWLAYQITEKTVIRAGAGIFYGTDKAPGLNGANNGFTNSPSWSSANQGITSAFHWDQGFPALAGASDSQSGFQRGIRRAVVRRRRNRQTRQHGQLEFRRLPCSCRITLCSDATYTGSKGTHLASDRVNIMQIDPKYAYLGTLLNKPIDDPAVVALGFKPPFANFKQLTGWTMRRSANRCGHSRSTRA